MEHGLPTVVAVHSSESHTFTKAPVDSVALVAGIGVEGDAHSGPLVKHRSRVARNPDQPNLRQVLLFTRRCSESFATGASRWHPASSART